MDFDHPATRKLFLALSWLHAGLMAAQIVTHAPAPLIALNVAAFVIDACFAWRLQGSD